jgi:hypothetical protein
MVSAEIVQTPKGPRVVLSIGQEHRIMTMDEAHQYIEDGKDTPACTDAGDCAWCAVYGAVEGAP